MRRVPLPPILQNRLRLPIIGAPMFIVSTPALVVAQRMAGEYQAAQTRIQCG